MARVYKIPVDKADEFRKYLMDNNLYDEEVHKLSGTAPIIEFIIIMGASAKAIMLLDDFYKRYIKGEK